MRLVQMYIKAFIKLNRRKNNNRKCNLAKQDHRVDLPKLILVIRVFRKTIIKKWKTKKIVKMHLQLIL